MAEPYTHIDIFNGQAKQVEVGDSFPSTREDAMYLDGTEDGLDDGDMYYDRDNQVLGVHIGSSWLMVPFSTS